MSANTKSFVVLSRSYLALIALLIANMVVCLLKAGCASLLLNSFLASMFKITYIITCEMVSYCRKAIERCCVVTKFTEEIPIILCILLYLLFSFIEVKRVRFFVLWFMVKTITITKNRTIFSVSL